MPGRRPYRIVSLGLAVAVLAACGDGSSSTSTPFALDAPPPTSAASDAPVGTAAATAPPTAPALGAADGCSPDNAPTPLAAAPGPAPSIAVRTESAGNALPDLAVRRINCGGGWVNLKNEIPAERPVLVWFWAPY